MTKSTPSTKKQDDVLADFTDHVLDGKPAVADSTHSDEELRGLEETVLLLNQTFPSQAIDEKLVKRMQFDFKIRRQKIAVPARSVFWWSRQTLQRVVLAVVIIAIIISIFLVIPFFPSGSGNIQGSAGLHPQSIGLLVVLAGVVLLLAIWLGRRK
ncbi:MAG TPA: hypothetical protein VLX61_06100 [Anaerolineales bacterium]|nr:hypothetical protein [Anaerolineales bacterium]